MGVAVPGIDVPWQVGRDMSQQRDELLYRLETADAQEFAAMVLDTGEAELREIFGDGVDELRALAQPTRAAKLSGRALGNVVVLHGILGAHLAEGDSTIWLNPWTVMQGRMERLMPGRAVIEPRGLLKRYYGKQLLTLGQRWNVRGFAYDWRLTLDEGARALAESMDRWFPKGEPVQLVAHSMGGLVARAFLELRPTHQGRLVMLGTPNRGSHSIPQLLHGMHSLLTPLALLDVKHSRAELLEIIRSWPGVHEMDPANTRLAGLPVDAERMIYIAGTGRSTAISIRDRGRLDEREGYEWSGAGDGTVPHCLGLLEGVPTYYVEEEHGALPNNVTVLAAVDEILEKGTTTRLATLPSGTRGEAIEASREMGGFLTMPRIENGRTKPTACAFCEVRCGDLAEINDVDAVAVGHYEGVAPRLSGQRPALQAMASQLPSGLGEPFYIPAPDASTPPILVIGMGPVGRLRETELRTLIERLIWAAQLFGIRRLATTLIGSGVGNLALDRAAAIWREALLKSELRVIFIERDAERAAQLARCWETPVEDTTVAIATANDALAPIARLSIERTRAGYRVALLTRDASIPEREIAVDHALVEEMNAMLTDRREDIAEWAECMRRVLLPAELRLASSNPGPMVVACDRATAQIGWEHLHPHVSRQFRSQKAPFRATHERARRVLLVADTCSDAPLAGAAEEGRVLAELLRERGLDVTALIGPREATRAAVLRELLLRRYDVMHYAGHCAHEPDDPTRSGWVFTGSTMLTGREMERLDGVPAFIFSNACESGRLADVPGFAEALFGLGVQNMVATSRPVGDRAAKAFALAFYQAASGPLHEAMRAGRLAAGAEASSWQHYGNPATLLLREPTPVTGG
jgi:pimeloyl-ACP methyl ester carboxylesterase